MLIKCRRQGWRDTRVLGPYLLGAGAIRFVVEFLRVDERVAGNLSVAHLASLAAMTAGLLLFSQRSPATIGNRRLTTR